MGRKIGYYFVELAYFQNAKNLIGYWNGEYWSVRDSKFNASRVTVLNSKPIINDPLPLNFWSRLESFVSDVQTNCKAGEEEREMIMQICKEKQNKL